MSVGTDGLKRMVVSHDMHNVQRLSCLFLMAGRKRNTRQHGCIKQRLFAFHFLVFFR
ncbi:hypothetical protein Barb7_02700 [Bacteroidales bacterium Barb7]|nr:hypothetical protein Barb7_02700 [Bacteroidales bacterium Barb7]